MTTLETRAVAWPEDKDIVTQLRSSVFIHEQGVPLEIEQDGKDDLPTTRHFIGLAENKAIATGRVLGDGKIGRICVLPEYRGQGLGETFLRSILRQILDLTPLTPLYLHAQINACGLYKRCGFVEQGEIFYEANIEHKYMHLHRDEPHALESIYQDQVIRTEQSSDLQRHLKQMVNAGRQRIDISSSCLPEELYSREVAQSLSHFARRNHRTQVRILVEDTRGLAQSNSPVIALAQRLPSSIKVKRLDIQPDTQARGYCVIDDRFLLYLNSEPEYRGFANYSARAESSQLAEKFEHIWQKHSSEDPNLSRFII